MAKAKKNRNLIDISTKTFIQVVLLLAALMVVAIALTYLVPKGEFGVLADESSASRPFQKLAR